MSTIAAVVVANILIGSCILCRVGKHMQGPVMWGEIASFPLLPIEVGVPFHVDVRTFSFNYIKEIPDKWLPLESKQASSSDYSINKWEQNVQISGNSLPLISFFGHFVMLAFILD